MHLKSLLAVGCLFAVLASVPDAHAEERFPKLPLEQMTPAQRTVAESIMGTRKRIAGPFNAWLRSPALADRLQAVGAYLRYESTLPGDLRELAIMVTAKHWGAREEWALHYDPALAAGLSKELLAELDRGSRPRGMTAQQAIVYEFTMSMHRDRARIADDLFQKAKAALGEQGVIDLVGVCGYYAAIAMTLNLSEGVRRGEQAP
ncbi:MAG TPA: carboxymuconolactone decarboxylase family protein [Nitrospiraceae bacterium]|nr:carboxymuconolactone decarboxylase family protein [Nitrospiraceae bacterium]